MKIILASSSPSRKRILKKTGLDFEIFKPDVDEKSLIDKKKPLPSLLRIARAKAHKARLSHKKACIIACDQMVLFKGKLYGKAGTKKKAVQTLLTLQGHTHTLISALVMIYGTNKKEKILSHKMSMRKMTKKEIESYVDLEKPLNSAGSYYIEGKGIKLFKKIKTEDLNAIEGLPVIEVMNQLEKWNFSLF